MPQINILNILEGDNQSTVVDKINYNFDQILSAGGGPQGQQGSVGTTGPIGPQGFQGVQGLQGPSGTKWFVQDNTPASGSIGGNNPFLFPSLGDYWLDPDSADQGIYVFNGTSWVDSGFGLGAGEIFQRINPINHVGGITGRGILLGGTASDQTLVLSDADISTYTPGGTAIDNLNYEDYKLKIATKDSRIGILSLGRSENDSIVDTTSGGNLNNSLIYWNDIVPGNPGYWSTTWKNPTGSITIQSLGGSSAGGVNLLANEEITAQSNDSNIGLITNNVDKGTFVSVNSTRGFLEISSSYPTNSAAPYLFVNSTGAGIGVGTGGFKETGDDARKLSVLGNASIGKSSSSHTGSIFTGGGVGVTGNDLGSLFVEGYGGFGYKNPTGSPGGTLLATTGPAESQNRFPQLWVSSYNNGPGLQIKTLGDSDFQPRTVIGDGVFDYQGAGISERVVAGTGPDITQEFYISGSPSFTNEPLISYQHKITDSANTTGTAPVFSVSTWTRNGAYNNADAADKTIIQTRNSNDKLEIRANSVRSTNKVSIGTLDESNLTVHQGTTADPGYGSTTIGYNSDLIKSIEPGVLPTGTFNVSNNGKGSASPGCNSPNHASVISGTQTIGSYGPDALVRNDSSTMLLGIKSFGAFPSPPVFAYSYPVSDYSMQKIHRNLYETASTSKLGTTSADNTQSPNIQNYPNGLEITSYINSDFQNWTGFSGTPTLDQRTSFAIVVGTTDNISTNFGSDASYANTTGFMVSDTGTNVSIGAQPNLLTSLTIDASNNPYVSGGGIQAMSIAGYCDFNGDMDVIGDVEITGDVDIIGNTEITGGNLKVGTPGTPIDSMIVGRIQVNVNGAPPVTIKAGTGYTASMVGSGPSLEVQINLNSAFPGVAPGTNPDGVVVMAQAISGSASTHFYCNSWTDTSFNLRGIGFSSGTVQVNFTAYSVS